jgi:hypothetical protein
VVDFAKLKLMPRSEQKEHLFRCNKCGEECWYTLELPEHMREGHLIGGIGRRCRGWLEYIASRWAHPELRSPQAFTGGTK